MEKAITLKMPIEKIEEVKNAARLNGCAVATLIRQVVYKYLEQQQEK